MPQERQNIRLSPAAGPAPPPQPVDADEAYHEFRGPGDVLREQTENLARSTARDAGAYRKTQNRAPKRTSRR